MNIDKKKLSKIDNLFHEILFLSQTYTPPKHFSTLQDISTTEVSILNVLYEKPELILKEINEIIKLPKSTLTSAIDRLERRGIIERTICKKDRRSYKLKLTERGVKAQKEHKAFEHEMYKLILGCFDNNEESQTFLFLLEKVLKEFKKSLS